MKKLRRFSALALILFQVFSPLYAEGGKVAVVLGGGGARGYAEIALLEKIEEKGIPVDMVLGTSMGALIGSLYSTGWTPAHMKEYIRSHNLAATIMQPVDSHIYPASEPFEKRRDNILAVNLGGKGKFDIDPYLLDDSGINEMFEELFGGAAGVTDFDELPIPFRAVATDAMTGEKIVYSEGSLLTAARSSMSIPIIFRPYPQPNGSYAVDGGLRDNLPIEEARALGADFVIAIDSSPNPIATEETMESMLPFGNQIMILVSPDATKQYPFADLVVVPELQSADMLAFDKFEEYYELGVAACEEMDDAFDELAAKIEESGRKLEPKDPDRPDYDWGKPRTISTVELDNLDEDDEFYRFPKELFKNFVGLPFDEEQREKLVKLLKRYRTMGGLSVCQYEVRNDDTPDTMTLIIHYKDRPTKRNSFTIGGYWTAGTATMGDGPFWFSPEIEGEIEFTDVGPTDLVLAVGGYGGNASELSFSLTQPFTPVFSFTTEVSGGVGSYVLSSHNGREDHTSPVDGGVLAKVGFGMIYFRALRAVLGAEYRGIYPYEEGTFHQMFSGYLGFTADTRLGYGLLAEGFRFDLLGRIGRELDEDLIGSLDLSIRHDWALDRGRHLLGYDLAAGCKREPEGFNYGYKDIGGLDGIPGYRYATLRQDYCYGAIRYRCKITDLRTIPLVFLSRVALGVFDDEDPFEGGEYQDGAPFSGDLDVYGGVEAGVGFETPIGNFAMGCGVSFNGDVTAFIGMIE